MNRWQRWDEILGRVEKFLLAAMLSIIIAEHNDPAGIFADYTAKCF
jgi:hypothetical protein